MSELLLPSCRVAFAALIHDLGKLAERAKLPISQSELDAHKTLYCPYHEQGHYHSHIHSAYTGFALDQIESYLPDLIQQDMCPFASRAKGTEQITDSLINAAAAHHKPDTFLQWIIATADRVASGFERNTFDEYNQSKEKPNHYTARLLTLFEQIDNQSAGQKNENLAYAYPLKPLSADGIFPSKRASLEYQDNEKAQQEYLALWQDFAKSLAEIPASHKQSWDLWLDHFDTAYQCFTGAIPSATAFNTIADVSLYDHSKTTAALATALWRWHEENGLTDNTQATVLKDRDQSWNEQKLLLIQGDFFGIQDFIFSGGSKTNKKAAKLLRGRSFQVSLFTELAALKILQTCQLPTTSQITNAAGKFLIVAPNTENVKQALKQVQDELNQWFVKNTYGLAGLGIATQVACCNDLVGNNFKTLQLNLFKQLEKAKLQRLDLTDSTLSVQNESYPFGACELNQYFPALENGLSQLSQDQITIGEQLVKNRRLMISEQGADIFDNHNTKSLGLTIFGYKVSFTDEEESTGKFGQLVKEQKIKRFWDYSLPKTTAEGVWKGYARRYINAYVPVFTQANLDELETNKYKNIDKEDQAKIDAIKPFDYIASEDRKPKDKNEPKSYIGQDALMTLKGDVDNLGTIFQQGLEKPSFAKMAALSRQMNQFFSLWLPAYCAENQESQNMYTVFAGGDDFFLIGPWLSTQEVAHKMQRKFADYVAHNPAIHFSVGMVMSKVGIPVPRLGQMAEDALELSKAFEHKRSEDETGQSKVIESKNAVTIYNRTISWMKWQALNEHEMEIERLADQYKISTAYLYSLIRLSQQASSDKLEDTMWRSHFHYRTARYVGDKLPKEQKEKALAEIIGSLGNGMENYKVNFAIPLFNYFYQKR